MFADAANIIGNLNGGTTGNTLDLSAYSTAVSVNIAASTSTGIGGTFSNLQTFVGNDSTTAHLSTITGPSTATNTWDITSINAGNINSSAYTFSGFGNISGDSGTSNTYKFSNGVVIKGTLNGGDPNSDVLDLTAYTTATDVTLTGSSAGGYSGTTPAVAGGFTNITEIDAAASGGSAIDSTLTLENVSTSVALSGSTALYGFNGTSNDGTFTLTFKNFDTIAGGTGGGVTNSLTAESAVTNVFTINSSNAGTLADGTATLNFSNFANLTGGTTSGSNAFDFTLTGSVSGNIIGGASVPNTIDLTGLTTQAETDVTLSAIGTNEGYDGTLSTSTIGGHFDNITVFNDTTTTNTLTGPSLATTWTIGSSANTGTVSDSRFSSE